MTVYVWVGRFYLEKDWESYHRTKWPSAASSKWLWGVVWGEEDGLVGCSYVKPGIGLNDPYGSFPTWNVLWFYDWCYWGMGHVPMGWAGQWGVVWAKCGWLRWLYQETRRCISHTMLLAIPHTGQAVFSCLQAACLSLHPSPSTTVQTTAFSSKKCPKYHYGQMFIQWSPQEILMLNHCPVFASKYNNLSILMSPIERDFNQNDSQGLMNIQQYLQGWSKSFSVYCSNVIVLLPYKHIY